jgi:hypothetical protein
VINHGLSWGIRDDTDYQNHLEYIKSQPLKHQLSEVNGIG